MPVNESLLSLAKTIVLLSKESPKTMYLRAFSVPSAIEDYRDEDGFNVDVCAESWTLKLCYHEDHVLVTDFGQAKVVEGGDVYKAVYRLEKEQYSFNRFKIDKSGTALSDFVTTWQVLLPDNLAVCLEKRQIFRSTKDRSIRVFMGEGTTLYQHKHCAREPESLTRLLVAMIKCGWAYSGQDALDDIPVT